MSWRLIWFFGAEYRGKATLIRDLKAGSSHELADRLRLQEGLESANRVSVSSTGISCQAHLRPTKDWPCHC